MNRIYYKFGNDQFKYLELKCFLHKAHRIPKLFLDDIITKFIKEGYIIKDNKNYKLKDNIETYINTSLEKLHLERNKVLLSF